MVVVCLQLLGHLLVKHPAAGRHVDGVDPMACLLADMLPAAVQRVRLHDSAPAPAVGVVVHLLLPVRRVVPDLMAGKLDVPALARTADDAFTQNALTHLGKQRGDINPHRHFPHRL